jgi:predicted transcriptional regulator
MIGFSKPRPADSPVSVGACPLGHLEISVMEILWSRGRSSSVHDVIRCLGRTLAYTTVMTTLDRLFKKGLLERRKFERAYVYSPILSRREWEQKRAQDFVSDFVADFVAGPPATRELLFSCFLDAVIRHDTAVLNELEEKIQMKRKELLCCDDSPES